MTPMRTVAMSNRSERAPRAHASPNSADTAEERALLATAEESSAVGIDTRYKKSRMASSDRSGASGNGGNVDTGFPGLNFLFIVKDKGGKLAIIGTIS